MYSLLCVWKGIVSLTINRTAGTSLNCAGQAKMSSLWCSGQSNVYQINIVGIYFVKQNFFLSKAEESVLKRAAKISNYIYTVIVTLKISLVNTKLPEKEKEEHSKEPSRILLLLHKD